MPRLSELLAQKAAEHNTGAHVARALNLTHMLSRMRNPSLETVVATMERMEKAMDTQQSGGGADWIATGFSPDLIQEVALQRKVSALFQRVRMPNNPYKFPVQGGHPTAYITAENTADTGQTSVKFSDAGTASTTFTATKISVAIRTSDEFEQDAITDVESYVNRAVLLGLVDGEENAIINGDTTGTHMDSDVTGSDDVRKAFKGLRKLANSGAKVDGGTGSLLTAIRTVRARMGAYGADPSKLVVITGTSGHVSLMEEGAVMTLDKFGPQATVLTGELGKIDGMPLIISAYVRENLNASGVFDNTTTNKTVIIVAHRDAFAIGDRLQVTLEPYREPLFGQDSLIGRERIDFQKWFASADNPVGIVYNVATL